MLGRFSGDSPPDTEILSVLRCLLNMSKQLHVIDNGVVFNSGQRGKPLDLEFSQLNKDEQAVLQTLRQSGDRMKIISIMEALEWDIPVVPFSPEYCKVKGYSRVRNAVRRLVRSGMIMHSSAIGDGTYMVPDIVPVATIAPVKLLPVANPLPVDIDSITKRAMAAGRKSDCAFYNACLDQAISNKWDGFSCHGCRAYAEPDEFQKEQNILGLRAVQTAADLVAKHGKVNRIRGVKPGADAKRNSGEMVSLSEVMAMTD